MTSPAPDPRWLEILKASGGQALALALACWGFIALGRLGYLPSVPEWVTLTTAFVGLLSAGLALVAIGRVIHRFFFGQSVWTRWRAKKAVQNRVRDYLGYLNQDEVEIIAYLLHYNQRSFTCTQDGGRAATLIGRGIVVPMIRGPAFSILDTPFGVPDHIWEVLEEQRHRFRYSPPPPGITARHPWREHVW